ncbi:hypothetical protein HMI54_014527 [Coelomomyces lativittatus]|nr:hypothetical protein HMI54_014527 [Coelomomyces lativittatus]
MPVPENIGIQKPVNMAGAEHNMVGKTLFSSIKFFEYDTSGKRVPALKLKREAFPSEISSLYHSYEGDFVGGYFKDTDNPYNWLGMRIVRKSGGFYMLQFFRNGEKNWYELNAWFTYNYGLGYVYGYVENMQDMDALPKCS